MHAFIFLYQIQFWKQLLKYYSCHFIFQILENISHTASLPWPGRISYCCIYFVRNGLIGTEWPLQQLLTRWFSKHLMYWWAVTQLGQRKLAQSWQRLTAFSLALQLVHTICLCCMAFISSMLIKTWSRDRSSTPLGSMVSYNTHTQNN